MSEYHENRQYWLYLNNKKERIETLNPTNFKKTDEAIKKQIEFALSLKGEEWLKRQLKRT